MAKGPKNIGIIFQRGARRHVHSGKDSVRGGNIMVHSSSAGKA